ncbi:MAG: HPr(Ser) kinase/phosphatase [Clostridiales bacterium]|nr:HPr(Ser) kinase/phosphatase [Clostridiales bacterium]
MEVFMGSVALKVFADEFELKLLTPDIDIEEKLISHPDINRPGLQLAGYFEFFDSERLQIIGYVEHTYLSHLDSSTRHSVFQEMFECGFPCLVFCRNLEPHPEMLGLAYKYGIPVFQTDRVTCDFMGEAIRWLKVQLAPSITIHGVLIDIYGEGVLIMGESGIGKSETALELIKRGHRLVADDAVEIKRVSKQTLIGSCPEIIRYFIELRGIGIIDIKQMFGVESIKATQSIDLIIKLEVWDSKKEYDRFGLNEEFTEILGNQVVCHSIPIRPGRNLAVICEAAAVNHRQKKMGHNASQILYDRISKNMIT